MSAASPVVTSERVGRTLVIHLDRPESRNAVNGALAQGVEQAIDVLEEADDLWVGVLAARGPVFCAGADLKAVSRGKGAELSTQRGGFGGLVRRKRSKPLIAAVHSDAFAGGFELALACDMVVAAQGIHFGLPEVKRSLVALAGALIELPRLVGEKVALEVALTGEPVSAERMYQLGVVNRLVEAEEVFDTAMGMAAAIADNGPLAVKASRQIIVEGRDLDLEASWKHSIEVGYPVFQSEDAKEGPMAFIQKRKPEWKGR